jgi:hypothetical protein
MQKFRLNKIFNEINIFTFYGFTIYLLKEVKQLF